MFNRKYIFNPGPFSIAMLDYRIVTFSELHQKNTKFKGAVQGIRDDSNDLSSYC